MARSLRIEWRSGDKITARLAMPKDPRPIGVLLAHGAGAGQESSFMTTMRDGLEAGGYPTMTFDYPYIEAGRKRPDQPATLEAAHRAAADRLATYVPKLVLAGKSMGGRIGGHVAASVGAVGLMFFGYPFVAIGSGKVRPLDHLSALDIPKLFVSGTKDAMGPLDRLRAAVGSMPAAEAALIQGGNHSLAVPKSSGLSNADVMDSIVTISCDWLGAL